jgi:hypothetical protein
VTVVLDALQLSEIVIEGKTTTDDATTTALKSNALLLPIQVISKPIIKLVAKDRNADTRGYVSYRPLN